MGFSYNKLWKLLIDKNMNKSEFQKAIELSPTTVAKLGKNETVNMDILARICDYFQCGIEDIVSYSPKKQNTKMNKNKEAFMDTNTPYIASLTREPFMYYEMTITAKLLQEGLSEDEVIEKIFKENLYQYPTERSLKTRTRACIKRLKGLEDEELLSWIVNRPLDISKQVCLYAFMKSSRLIWEFMITVIGEKYRTKNFTYNRMDLNVFFTRLQEQNDTVASWSDATIGKLKSVLSNLLKETGYIDSPNSKKLNEVLLDYKLKEKIKDKGDETCLPAFNYFE